GAVWRRRGRRGLHRAAHGTGRILAFRVGDLGVAGVRRGAVVATTKRALGRGRPGHQTTGAAALARWSGMAGFVLYGFAIVGGVWRLGVDGRDVGLARRG